jgi:hypothetical protein
MFRMTNCVQDDDYVLDVKLWTHGNQGEPRGEARSFTAFRMTNYVQDDKLRSG